MKRKLKYLFYRYLFFITRNKYYKEKYQKVYKKINSISKTEIKDKFYQINGVNNHIFIIEDGKETELTKIIPGLEIIITGN